MIAKVETSGGCKILRVSGRIDFESALDFEHQINAMLLETGECYIIELSQVELLSSAGLRVMLSTAKRVAHRNASLALAAPSQVVRQVFEISHFNLLFKIFPSVPAAIAALKGTAEVAPPAGSGQDVLPGLDPLGQEQARPTDLIVPRVKSAEKPPLPQKVEAPRPDSSPTVLQASIVPQAAEAPAVAPPPLPPAVAVPDSAKAPDATAAPRTAPGPPPRRVPPPIPSANQLAPVLPAAVEPPAARPTGQVTRREAKYPALLEVRAEGISYQCKDGDVIGTEGRLGQPYFSQITNLAPRHLLIGQLEGRWFVFTPKNVQHPFILDGVVLRAGERKMLQYLEHQVEFSGHVFGFRLVSEQPKEGFFSRVFGRKR